MSVRPPRLASRRPSPSEAIARKRLPTTSGTTTIRIRLTRKLNARSPPKTAIHTQAWGGPEGVDTISSSSASPSLRPTAEELAVDYLDAPRGLPQHPPISFRPRIGLESPRNDV